MVVPAPISPAARSPPKNAHAIADPAYRRIHAAVAIASQFAPADAARTESVINSDGAASSTRNGGGVNAPQSAHLGLTMHGCAEGGRHEEPQHPEKVCSSDADNSVDCYEQQQEAAAT